jgi:hypothetical protein
VFWLFTDVGFLMLASWWIAARLQEPAMNPDTTLVSLSMREPDILKAIQAIDGSKRIGALRLNLHRFTYICIPN